MSKTDYETAEESIVSQLEHVAWELSNEKWADESERLRMVREHARLSEALRALEAAKEERWPNRE